MQAVYLSVVRTLRAAIRNGEYAQKPFPSETQLMRRFGIGRQTAVRALNELEREGLVVRRKGADTFLSKAEGLKVPGTAGRVRVVWLKGMGVVRGYD